MKKIVNVYLIVAAYLTIVAAGNVFSDNLSVQITSPKMGAHFENCSDIDVDIEATVENSEISKVEIYQNKSLVKTDTRTPYDFSTKNTPNGIYEFYAKATDSDGNEATSSIIIIKVGNTDDGNLVINGEFNCKIQPWRLDQYVNAKATFEIIPELWLTDDSSGAMISIQEQGDAYWAVQLMQPFKLQSGHTYEVSFVAEADESKDIEVTFSQDYDPFGPHWVQPVTVSKLSTYGPFTFECDIDDPQVMFKFVVGGNLIPIYLDAIKVIDKQWTDVEQKQKPVLQQYQLYQNYPNPFNPETTIKYTLSKAEKINLTIFNLLGEQIISFSGLNSAGAHTIKWNGLDSYGNSVNSGVYLYKLNADGFSSIRKMLLVR